MNKAQKKIRISRILTYVFLFIAALAFLFPIFWMYLSSFKTLGEVLQYPPTFFPENPTFSNFIRVWGEMDFGIYMRNSIFISVLKTVIIVYTSAFAGYGFAKIKFFGRDKIFIFILITMMVPWPVLMIPMYYMMKTFGMYNSYWSLIVPFIFHSFGIFLMRQFAIYISDETIESAKIDGANQFTIFHRIIFPQMIPAISALGIFIFLWTWDDFIWPYLMLNDPDLYTVPIGLSLFTGLQFTDTSGYLAAASITLLPILIVFLIFQKRFVEGLTFTGIK